MNWIEYMFWKSKCYDHVSRAELAQLREDARMGAFVRKLASGSGDYWKYLSNVIYQNIQRGYSTDEIIQFAKDRAREEGWDVRT